MCAFVIKSTLLTKNRVELSPNSLFLTMENVVDLHQCIQLDYYDFSSE